MLGGMDGASNSWLRQMHLCHLSAKSQVSVGEGVAFELLICSTNFDTHATTQPLRNSCRQQVGIYRCWSSNHSSTQLDSTLAIAAFGSLLVLLPRWLQWPGICWPACLAALYRWRLEKARRWLTLDANNGCEPPTTVAAAAVASTGGIRLQLVWLASSTTWLPVSVYLAKLKLASQVVESTDKLNWPLTHSLNHEHSELPQAWVSTDGCLLSD